MRATFRFHLTAALIALGAVSGCATPPRIDTPALAAATGPKPVILPLDEVIASAQTTGAALAAQGDLGARAARLRARAAGMRGAVLDPETSARLTDAAGG